MDCRDVAIYNVSNRNYARLMSSTSESARRLGNSIAYTEYTQMVEAFKNRTVFVNRQLTENVPLMAAAILSNDEIQSIIMLWDISWDRLNLSFMNRFQVIGYLIQNAVLRANRYIDVLEHERYINGTKILEPAAFRTLLKAFLHAQQKGLTDCSLIQITSKSRGYCTCHALLHWRSCFVTRIIWAVLTTDFFMSCLQTPVRRMQAMSRSESLKRAIATAL